jgi:hypothetical protein
MKVHVNRFAHIGVAGAVQGQRDPGLIEVRIETGRTLECPDVKFIGKLERDFSLIWDGSGHGGVHKVGSDGLSYAAAPAPLMI